MNATTLGIFAKEPRPHRVKTRLARDLGAEAAADLYTAMLADTVTWATEIAESQTVLFYDGAHPSSYLEPELLKSVDGWPQGGGDLGARLAAATALASQRGWLPLLFLGSDSTDLPPALVRAAVDALAATDVVLGPTEDGGVWCIGLRSEFAGFFDGLPWSSPETGASLRERAARKGLRCEAVPPWNDVDDADDLLALARRLRRAESRAPRTERWLTTHESLISTCVETKRAEPHRGSE